MVTLTAPQETNEEYDTNQLSADQFFGPIRSITVQMTEASKTEVKLFFRMAQKEVGRVWAYGYWIKRNYDCEPQAPISFKWIDPNDKNQDAYNLGDAVIHAAEAVIWAISNNAVEGDDNSLRARECMESWTTELDPQEITESVFDDDTEACAFRLSLGKKLGMSPDQTVELQEFVDDLLTQGKPQQDFDDRRHELEGGIATAAIEQARLKVAIKINRDNIKSLTDTLEKHLRCGPGEMPLFDKVEKEVAQADAVEDAGPLPNPAAESWRSTAIADLKELTPKIVDILDGEHIRTIGDWVDWPAQHPGVEYTQIKNPSGSITEARYDKIVAAMDAVTTKG